MDKELDMRIEEAMMAYLASGLRRRWTIRSSTTTLLCPISQLLRALPSLNLRITPFLMRI